MSSIKEIIETLFKIEEWEHPDNYFDEYKPPPLKNACATEKMPLHFQSARQKELEPDNSLTALFIPGEDGIIPVTAFEPEDSPTEGLRFRPISNIPFFDRQKYNSKKDYEAALQLMFSPVGYKNHHSLNIDLRTNPGLMGLCSTVTARLVYEMKQREDVEVVAELRTKNDKQSCVLVKFQDQSLTIFDRTAACYVSTPQELLLGWYAPLFTGKNQSELPQFDKYKEMYEAYQASSFILNRNNMHIKEN